MDTNQETGVSLDDLANSLDIQEQGDELETEALDEQTPEQDELPEEQAEESEELPDDLVDTEFEGKAYKVPKELKEALLRQADYTKKTQEVAELRRAVEERAQLVQMQEQFSSATFEKAVELRQLQERLSQFENLDWQALSDNDPVQAQKLLIARQQLERQASMKAQEFQQTQAQLQQMNAAQRQQMLQEQSQALKARLPEFNSEMASRIRSAVKEYGYSDQELANVTDARLVHVLHDAMKWRELQAAKPKAMKKVAEAPQVVKPQAQVPKPRNQAAAQRLKQHGRVEDLASFL